MPAFSASTVWPSSAVPEGTQQLLERLLQLADDKRTDAGKELAEEVFSPDGQFVSPGGTFTGRDEIVNSRKKAWDVIQFRSHTVSQVYVFGKDGRDIVFTGVLEADTKDAKTITDFAARAVIVGEPGSLRLSEYKAWSGASKSSPL